MQKNFKDSAPERQNEMIRESQPGAGRRRFLEALGGAGALLALGGVCRLLPVARARALRVRPPGGQREQRFESRCLKCNRCEEVCPTRVIGLTDGGDGVVASRTPRLRFKLGYCNFCMKCVDVCPTGALEAVDKNKARIGLAVIQKDVCIPWQWGGCTKCYERCPVKAITLDEQKRPLVDEVKCNGCGLCEWICPATELRSYSAGQQRGVLIIPPPASGVRER